MGLSERTPASPPPTRIGFVGVNDRARRLLLPGLAAAPRARLTAVCSRDPARAGAAAAAIGPDVRPFTRVEEMAGSGTVDAVFVNTPTVDHAPACLAAIRAGCAVICEKPLATSTAEAVSLCQAAAAAGAPTAVNFTYRSVPGFRLTERVLASGTLGRPLHAEVALLQGHNFLPGFPRASALLDSGVHLLDVLLALAAGAGMGPVTAVAAAPMLDPPATERDTPGAPGGVDFGWAFLARTASGRVVAGHFSRSALGWRNGLRWGLYGERAALDVELDAGRTTARLATPEPDAPTGTWRALPLPPDVLADDAAFPRFHLDRLVGAVRGEETFPDFGAALATHHLADALAAAAAGGGWAPVAMSP